MADRGGTVVGGRSESPLSQSGGSGADGALLCGRRGAVSWRGQRTQVSELLIKEPCGGSRMSLRRLQSLPVGSLPPGPSLGDGDMATEVTATDGGPARCSIEVTGAPEAAGTSSEGGNKMPTGLTRFTSSCLVDVEGSDAAVSD